MNGATLNEKTMRPGRLVVKEILHRRVSFGVGLLLISSSVTDVNAG